VRERLLWANIYAAITTDAACAEPLYLLHGSNAFGIVAPLAMQRTAFEKDGRAQSRAILGGEALQVQD
jgi:hypothetical protein